MTWTFEGKLIEGPIASQYPDLHQRCVEDPDDDDPIWEAGRFVFLDRPEQQALLGNYLDHPGAFDMCWDIGL